MSPRVRHARSRRTPWWVDTIVLLSLVAVAAMMLAGWFVKLDCIGPHYNTFGISTSFDANKHAHYCYSDIQQLWPTRGISAHVFPYLHGGLRNNVLTGSTLEYPVLTGVFVWLTAIGAHTDGQFLAISAACLAPFGLLTGGLLARLTGRRAFIFAAAPAVLFYAFLNWDLLAVAAFVTAVWCWSRGRPVTAALLLGVGAALKLYPGLGVLPLALHRLSVGDRRGAVKVVVAGAGVFIVVNLPFALANPAGLWATYAFQSTRAADITTNSIWYWGTPTLSTSELNALTGVLVVAAWVGALGAGWWQTRDGAPYPWLQVTGSMTCAFLVLNKVHSPQYVLWVLPFLVLIRVRWGWWVAYWIFDAALFFGLDRWYYLIGTGGDDSLVKQLVIIGVWGRAASLALLYVVFLATPLALKSVRQASGAPSSTPPAGSSTPSARTTSRSGDNTSRTTNAP
ncbi:MAG TPA: glycosyltransferase 87 family protein [Mycobacteriales bacterium]|jgi:uncharacterized membrane protein|nr:glycosyltransferase 87 family protein [Mycobacteriales bacterium]